MSRSLLIDPRSERAANAPLEIHRDPGRGPGVYVTEHSYPRPSVELRQIQRREGKRSSGAPVLGNRQIPLELFVVGRHETLPDLTQLAPNPSFETGLTGWSLVSTNWTGATFTQSPTWSDRGEYAARIVGTKDNSATQRNIYAITPIPPAAGAIVALGNTAYRARAKLCVVDAPAQGVSLNIDWYTAANAFISTDSSSAFTGTGEADLALSVTAPPTAAFAVIWIRGLSSTALDTVDFYVDAVNLVAAANPVDYFDGDSPGCAWTGTPGGSTSTQPGNAQKFFEAMVTDAEAALWKLQLEGGTYARPFEVGRLVFDVDSLAGGDDGAHDGRRFSQQGSRLKATLDCLPYGRAATESGSVQNQTTDPVCVWSEAAVGGNVRALGEMEIVETGSKDRRGFIAAIEQPDYDSTAATAALQLLAKDLTLLGTGALQARTGSHGGNTVKATLSPNWTAHLSTKIAASGLHLTHVGSFRIWGRVYAPSGLSGEISTRLEWGQGDLLARELLPIDIVEQRNGFYLIDFGTVRIEKAKAGTQRWEARWLAKSTIAGDTLEFDDLRIVPLDFAAVKVSRPIQLTTPSTFSARDEFDQSAGALVGKVAPVGGTWTAFGGDTDDFAMETVGKTARRTSNGDTAMPGSLQVGRAVSLGTTSYAVIGSSVDFRHSGGVYGSTSSGLLLRAVDTSNYLLISLDQSGPYPAIEVRKIVAGVETVLLVKPVVFGHGGWYTLAASVDAVGSWAVWLITRGSQRGPAIAGGNDAALATGGALATGKLGIFDADATGASVTRDYDNFAAWVPTPDAAIFSGRRLRWRHDGVLREDSAGTLWSPVGDYEGDPLLVPAAGREKRTLRCIAFPTRGDLDQLPDGVATAGSGESDDFTAQLTRIARYANVRK